MMRLDAKRLGAVLGLCVALCAPAWGKTYAVPSNDPVMTLKFPDGWKTEDIDYGFSATDPDNDVSIYVESASGEKGADGLMALNKTWMAEQKIKPDGDPDKRTVKFGDADVTIYTYAAHDPNGPTLLQFFVIPARNDRVILLTVWGSKEEQDKHKVEIDSVYDSMKPID